MKLSCLPVSLYPELSAGRWSLADWFRFAAELRLDGADVSVVHLGGTDAGHLRALRGQAEDAGVQIAMLVSYADFTHPDAAERVRQVDGIRHYLGVAHELGAEFIRVTAGQAHPGLARAAALEWAVAGLTACLDEAAQAGITLAYENHTKGYAWTYNDFSQPASIFLEIVARTEGTGLRILYDTANTLAAGDDPLAVLEAVKHRVAVIHTNDIARAGFFEPVVLGEGVAPIIPIYRTLIETGFDGWVSVEEAGKQGPDGFRRAIPYADRAWVQAGGQPRPARVRSKS
ncbi:MAG: sugar phosphate isomerase/epimerase [Thermomicrobiales bacterium]|nr:sugar phosphate isomerase/epimerase [Thermomicrobiales bacterium]